jgi:putative transposase
MPRKPRVVAAGVPHHVTQRGNNRQDIFLVDQDRQFYLAALAANSHRYGLHVVGYCLMTVSITRTPRGNGKREQNGR